MKGKRRFRKGDKVIIVGPNNVESPLYWNPEMAEYIGKPGIVNEESEFNDSCFTCRILVNGRTARSKDGYIMWSFDEQWLVPYTDAFGDEEITAGDIGGLW
jgi:hypothetical protein